MKARQDWKLPTEKRFQVIGLATILLLGATGQLGAQAPSPPTALQATVESESQVKLTWRDSGNEAEYKVQSAKEDSAYTTIATLSKNSNGFLATGLEEATKYRFRVNALSDTNLASSSNEVSIATLLSPPSKVVATAVSSKKIDLTWEYGRSETAFVIEQSTTSGSDFKEIFRTAPGQDKHSVESLVEETEYFFIVKAVEEGHRPRASSEVKASTTKSDTDSGDWEFKPDPKSVPDLYDPSEAKRITTCSFQKKTCNQPAVFISGENFSTIEILDLPPTLTKIRINGGNNWSGIKKGLDRQIVEFASPAPTSVYVDLYRGRKLLPAYGGLRGSDRRALFAINPQRGESIYSLQTRGERRNFQLAEATDDPMQCDTQNECRPRILVSSRATVVQITAYWMDKGIEKSFTLPGVRLVFQRWWIDIGGFYAYVELGDEELVTQSVPTEEGGVPMVSVLRKAPGREADFETGIMSTIFPSNYPTFGLSFGIAENSGRSLSYYFGPSVRFLGKQSSAVMTLSAGIAAIPVQRFPGVNTGELPIDAGEPLLLPSESPLLDGEVSYRTGGFFAITLGYGLDRRSGNKD